MFVTVEETKRLTGYDVTLQTVTQAQTMIEVWIGRTEVDINNASDLALLEKAAAFQAAYIHANPEIAFEQVALESLREGETTTVFDTDNFSPFMSPWAVRACGRLSWARARSIRTGPMFDGPAGADRWLYL